jgi:hypothetical protein
MVRRILQLGMLMSNMTSDEVVPNFPFAHVNRLDDKKSPGTP